MRSSSSAISSRLDGARDALEARVDPQRQEERAQRGARPAQAQEALAEAGLCAEVVRVELQRRRAVAGREGVLAELEVQDGPLVERLGEVRRRAR